MSVDNSKMKKVLEQLNSWCTKYYPQVQSVYDDCAGYTLQQLIYYLLGVVKECVDQVVENSDAFNTLEKEFVELKEFVDNYFDNLDVQEEINNKLEEMFNNGKLNDLLNLFIPYVTPEMYGCLGDGETDDSINFQKAVEASINKKIPLILSGKTYFLNNSINLTGPIRIIGQNKLGYKNVDILYSKGNDEFSVFTNTDNATIANSYFENISIARSRTSQDGYPNDPFATGKHGTVFDIDLNECSVIRCGFIGFGSVFTRASICDIVDCSIIYCSTIFNMKNIINSINVSGLNAYECDCYIKTNNFNIQGFNTVESWLESVDLIYNIESSVYIYGLNSRGTTFSPYASVTLFRSDNSSSYRRIYYNSKDDVIYCNKIFDGTPTSAETLLVLDSLIFTDDTDISVNIICNKKPFSSSGGNREEFSNTGLSYERAISFSPLKIPKNYTGIEEGFNIRNTNILFYNNIGGNNIAMIPCVITSEQSETPQDDYLQNMPLWYMVLNIGATSAGNYILALRSTSLNTTKILSTV